MSRTSPFARPTRRLSVPAGVALALTGAMLIHGGAGLAASPGAAASPVEHVWSSTGGPDGMKFPWDMAIDAEGRVWVADTGNSRFAIFSPDGAFLESWGTKGAGPGQFNLQRDGGDGYGAIEFAPDGSFYVLDVGNHRVQHFGPDRTFLGAWGSQGPGPGQFKDPIGLAIDAEGVVYVLDDQRALVEMYDPDGTVLGSFDPHLAGRNSANSSALDAQGNLAINACCLAGNHIQRIATDGTVLQRIGADGTGPGLFADQPLGIDVDPSGLVLASQWGSGSNIQVFGPDGGYLAEWDGTNGGDFDQVFPAGIALDGQGDVYVTVANFDATTTAGNSLQKFRLLPPFDPATLATTTPPSTVVTASPPPTIGIPADDGARITHVQTVDARTRDLTVDSPAVGQVTVRLLLPAQFDAEPTADWPVLYLLHGAWGNHADWTTLTDVEALTEPTDLLVVMPDAGPFGWYTDAWNHGKGGQPAWETFHLTELRQLLERNWNAGDRRVVAGLSMGGLGAMDYAARNPGMFRAAASYSGVLDTFGGKVDLQNDAIWGDPVEQAGIWNEHDPLHLADRLAGIPLYISYGDGTKGPLDTQPVDPGDLEGWIAPQNDAFVRRLGELGIPATVDAYGAGTHSWPYWERALHASLPMLLEAVER